MSGECTLFWASWWWGRWRSWERCSTTSSPSRSTLTHRAHPFPAREHRPRVGRRHLVTDRGGRGDPVDGATTSLGGLLCVAPFALATHAWRQRLQQRTNSSAAVRSPRSPSVSLSVVTTLRSGFVATCEWIVARVLIIVVFALWEVLFIAGAQAIAGHHASWPSAKDSEEISYPGLPRARRTDPLRVRDPLTERTSDH